MRFAGGWPRALSEAARFLVGAFAASARFGSGARAASPSDADDDAASSEAVGGGFVDVSGDRRLLEPGVRVSSSLLSAADAKDPRNGWTCDRLAAQLYLLGLPYTGKRDELIARLFTALDEDAKEADADVYSGAGAFVFSK